MPTGVVKWFNKDERQGYITPDEVGGDVLLLSFRDWEAGDRVDFEMLRLDSGKMRATYINKVRKSNGRSSNKD